VSKCEHGRDKEHCCKCKYGDINASANAQSKTEDATTMMNKRAGYRLVKGFNLLRKGGDIDVHNWQR